MRFKLTSLRIVARPFESPVSRVAAGVRKSVQVSGRVLSHPGFVAGLAALAIAAASAWGYWYYETSFRHPQELASLRQETQRLQSNLDTLTQSAEGTGRSTALSRGQRANEVSLLSPMDGIRALDQLAFLAERTNVALRNVQLSPGKPRAIGNAELAVFDVGFSATGDLGDLTDFSLALEEGILPGLFIENVQTEVDGQPSVIHASGSLYTSSTLSAGAQELPAFAMTGAPEFDGLESEVSVTGDTEVPILAFAVESQFDGMDALQSIQIQSSQPEILSSLKLYATASTDEADCQPALLSSCQGQHSSGQGVLIDTVSTARSDGSYIIRPVSPFDFPGQRVQRFYLSADLHSLRARQAVVEVGIPPQGVTFTSSKWPQGNVPSLLARTIQVQNLP